jgi:hypothetical protein
MTLDGSLSQHEEISWPKMGILKWPLTELNPLGELQIRVDDKASALGRLRYHLRQQFRLLPGKSSGRKGRRG